MPYYVTEEAEGCAGYAVVKDEGSELVGCHRTRTQALAQLAALNIAEPQEDRAGTGPRAVITDIDGTLISEAGANRELLDYLDETDAAIIVITGRAATRRAETEALLARLDLDYDLLEMSRGGDPNAHKKAVADRLLDRFTITEAFDDNPDARAAYAELGISARPPKSNRALAEEILASVRAVR